MVSNAIKFMEKGGITITHWIEQQADQNDMQLHFSVKDTGMGLTEEEVMYKCGSDL